MNPTTIERIMPFGDHLEELRRRLFHALIGLGVLFVVSLYFGGVLLEVLSAPLLNELKANGQAPSMLATSPLETFGAYIKVATVAALVVGMPWLLFQMWLFVAPGLYPREQRFAHFLLPLSGVLTMIGLSVLYWVILPISLYFLISFGSGLIPDHHATITTPPGVVYPSTPVFDADPTDAPIGATWINKSLGQLRFQIEADRVMGVALSSGGMIAQQYRVREYVDLVFMLGLAFAVAFQVPLVLLLLSWMGIVEAEQLTSKRKQVFFGCVIGAALLPTQDPWSLVLLSGMLIALFEFGILLIRFVPARRVAGKTPTDADAEA
jgi:sec-independent protein translocase protein TatC